jgi:hypothetical protein
MCRELLQKFILTFNPSFDITDYQERVNLDIANSTAHRLRQAFQAGTIVP